MKRIFFVIALGLASTGCTRAQLDTAKSVLDVGVAIGNDALLALDATHSLFEAFVAAHPTPAAKKAEIETVFADTADTIRASEALADGTSKGDIRAAYSGFVTAWGTLKKVLTDAGIAVPVLPLGLKKEPGGTFVLATPRALTL